MEWVPWLIMPILATYAILILAFCIGWKRLKVIIPPGNGNVYLSVVVAARNEQANILKCLESLADQNYPANLFEVIVVNDHSTDATGDLVTGFIESRNLQHFRLMNLEDFSIGSGKKKAITAAINLCKGNYIVTTDADCVSQPHWLSTLGAWINEYKPAMLIGPVLLYPARSVFEKMQTLEFCSLAGSTAGAAGLGLPVMCNGANLAFSRQAFLEVGGYEGNAHFASGDDVFLLHKFSKEKKGAILFVKDKNAIVNTPPVPTAGGFLRQRMRWASKTSGYQDLFTLLVAMVVAVVNILLVAVIGLAFIDPAFWIKILAGALFVKAMVDLSLLWRVTKFFQIRKLLGLFPVVFFLYPFYVVISAFLSYFVSSAKPWK